MKNRYLAWKCRRCVNACLHLKPAATCTYEHLVGAYGVVGFSRVKDERKGVYIADAVRRRVDSTMAQRILSNYLAPRKRFSARSNRPLSNYWAITRQLLSSCSAFNQHLLSSYLAI